MNWSQLKAIIWVRFRLTVNQIRRAGIVSAIIMGLAAVMAICTVIGIWTGSFIGGWLGLSKANAIITLLVWDGIALAFVFGSIISLMAEAKRAESLDIGRLLHLPVSLGGVFVMNYLSSFVDFVQITLIPAIVGLCLGLVVGKGLWMTFMFPLALSFVFMVTAWFYCVRGWLASIMVNPRRRRQVVVGLTVGIILIVQLPNLVNVAFMNHRTRAARERPAARQQQPQPETNAPAHNEDELIPESLMPYVTLAHDFVPLLWLPKGAAALVTGDPLPAVLGTFGMGLLGIAGLGWSYRSTIRFYCGYAGKSSIRAAAQSSAPRVLRPTWLHKQLPVVAEEPAALALAFIRSMSRAPEFKMALIANVMMLLSGGVGMLVIAFNGKPFHGLGSTPELFIVTGVAAVTFFGLIQPMANQFGYDRDGFRGLVLLPARRRDILLAKNLAVAPVALGFGLCALALLEIGLRISAFAIIAGIFQLFTLLMMFSLLGNFLSIWLPYRISAGSLKPSKPPLRVMLLAMLTQLTIPIILLPAITPAAIGFLAGKFGLLPPALVEAFFSLLFLGLTAWLYWISLDGLGNFLEKREQEILRVVTEETD